MSNGGGQAIFYRPRGGWGTLEWVGVPAHPGTTPRGGGSAPPFFQGPKTHPRVPTKTIPGPIRLCIHGQKHPCNVSEAIVWHFCAQKGKYMWPMGHFCPKGACGAKRFRAPLAPKKFFSPAGLPTQALPPGGGGRHPPFSRVPRPTHGCPQKPYPDPCAYVYMAKNTPATSLKQ